MPNQKSTTIDISEIEKNIVKHPEIALNMATRYVNENPSDDSIRLLNALTSRHPIIHDFWAMLSDLYTKNDESEKAANALAQYKMIKQFNESLNEAQNMFNNQNIQAAERICRQLLNQVPNEIRTLRLMAKISQFHSRFDISVAILAQCHASKPDDIEIGEEYINALINNKQFSQAANKIEYYLPRFPQNTALLAAQAIVNVKTGNYLAAIELYENLKEIHPNKALCLIRLGNVLKIIGKYSQAILCYKQAIELDPSIGEAYWNLANLKTYLFSAAEIEMMQAQILVKESPKQQVALLNFALGKALEDKQQYEESFAYYQQANKLCFKPQQIDQNLNNDKLKVFFNSDYFSKNSDVGHPSDEAIFIVGLPRSGSTLVEQILASHPQVDGTMELTEIAAIATELNIRPDGRLGNYPESVNKLSAKQITDLGQRYLNFAAPMRSQGRYFIDKLPANFQHLGLIKTLFPKAKIIDVRREPMACGWSIYTQFFAGGVSYAFDQKTIAEHHNVYVELMKHWNEVLPQQILTVSYEDLITKFEPTVETILNYCNLDMRPECLNFYENNRAVATPSAEQVRQPIYTDALTHWRNYERFLAPLKDALKGV